VELGPVHRHQDVPSRANLMRHPAGEAVPHVDALVAHQTVDLLDRVLGHQTARLRQRLADHSHRQRGVRHDSERCPANASTRLACRSGPYSPPIKDRTSSSRRPPKHPAPTIPGPLPKPQRSYKLLANRGYPWVTKNEGIREGSLLSLPRSRQNPKILG